MTWVLKEIKGGPVGRPGLPRVPARPRPPRPADPGDVLRAPKPPAPAGYEWVWRGTPGSGMARQGRESQRKSRRSS